MSRLWFVSPRDYALPDKPESSSLKQWLSFTQDRIQCGLADPPQHFLNFFPLPQGQVALRPTLGCMAFATVRSWTAILSGIQ